MAAAMILYIIGYILAFGLSWNIYYSQGEFFAKDVCMMMSLGSWIVVFAAIKHLREQGKPIKFKFRG